MERVRKATKREKHENHARESVRSNKLQFWLGDLVRIKQKKSTFEKGESLYSDSVYKVVTIKRLGTMKLEYKYN